MYDKAEKVVKNLSSIIFDLRAENESLYDTIEIYSKRIDELREETEQLRTELNTLKSDIDKAIKYIKENKLYNFSHDKEEIFYTVSDKKARNKLLNILGGD